MAANFSDRQLRQLGLRLRNAYDQPQLALRPVCDTDRLLDIVNIYEHEKWPAEKIYCSRCAGHHHKRGLTALVVTVEGVQRMLFGSHCGSETFGQTWQTAEKRMKDLHDRQYELKRLDRIEPIITPFLYAVSKWRTPVVRAINHMSAFSRRYGELHSRLREAYAVHGGMLTVIRITKVRNDKDHFSVEPYARLVGAAAFDQIKCLSTIDNAKNQIEVIAEQLPDTNSISLKLLKARRRGFEHTLEDLERVSKFYEGVQRFLTDKTFELVVRWVTRFNIVNGDYHFTGDGIQKDYEAEFKLPPELPDLDATVLDLIAEYRRAD